MYFKVGDVCKIMWVGNSACSHLVGTECEIVSMEPHCKCGLCHCRIVGCDGVERDCGFDCLRKKKPPYDGYKVTTWDLCPWQPRELA